MRNALFAATLAASLLTSVSASADGGAAEAVSYTWTGLYGGINAGYGWQKSEWDFGSGGSNSQQGNSGMVGLQVGYDAQIGDNLFAGIEGSLEASNLEGTSSCMGGQTCKTRLNSLSDIAVRLGIVQNQALLYLKGGLAYEDSDYHLGPNRDTGGAVGYVVGGGVEYPLMYNLTTKLEYNYMDFGKNDFTVGNERISVKEPVNLVKLGFNFKFD